MELTQSRLLELFSYDAQAGHFIRRTDKGPYKANSRAGRAVHRGYRKICIDYHEYYEHRLVWLYMTGAWPQGHIDHVNGVTSDNRFANLRDTSHVENMHNLAVHRGDEAQPPGVTRAGGKWRARVGVSKERKTIGYFSTKSAAHIAQLISKTLTA